MIVVLAFGGGTNEKKLGDGSRFSASAFRLRRGRSRKVVAFGDSNTRGSNWQFRDYPKAEKWVNLLQTSLQGQYKINNAGIGGETTEDARFRFRKDVLDKQPAYLFIMFGTNDAAILTKGLPRVSKKRFKENLYYFVKESRRRGIEPVS